MTKKEFAPVTPGEMLKEEFLAEYGLSQNQLAKAIGISPNRITEIVNNRRRITADTALRLSLYFGNSPEFWLNLQSHYDQSASASVSGPKNPSKPKNQVMNSAMRLMHVQPSNRPKSDSSTTTPGAGSEFGLLRRNHELFPLKYPRALTCGRSSSGASFDFAPQAEPQSRHLQSWSRIFWLRFANQT